MSPPGHDNITGKNKFGYVILYFRGLKPRPFSARIIKRAAQVFRSWKPRALDPSLTRYLGWSTPLGLGPFLNKVLEGPSFWIARGASLLFCCAFLFFPEKIGLSNFGLSAYAKEPSSSQNSDSNSEKLPAVKTPLSPVEDKTFQKDREKLLEDLSAQQEGKNWRNEINSYLIYLPSRRAKSSPAKLEITEAGFEYSYEIKLFGQLPLTFSLDNEYIGINDTAGLELPSHLVGLSMGFETALPFFNFEKTYINLGIKPSFYGDDWSFRSSAFRIPTDIFLIYAPKDKLMFIGGVAVCPDFKNAVLPIIGCIYKPNEKLSFEFTSDESNITYSLNDKLSLFFEATSPIGSEFEVKRSGRKSVVLQYNEMLIGGGIKYKLNKFIESSLALGGAFNRYIKYRDEDGKVSIGNGLYTEFRVDVEI